MNSMKAYLNNESTSLAKFKKKPRNEEMGKINLDMHMPGELSGNSQFTRSLNFCRFGSVWSLWESLCRVVDRHNLDEEKALKKD